MKSYPLTDIFFTEWRQLSHKKQAFVFSMYLKSEQLTPGTIEYGIAMIAILRALRKKPLIVDKIKEHQVPDIFNEIKSVMLSGPWYDFPEIKNWIAPAEKMAQCSFDQFIYADNEFTSYLATEDEKYLKRLAVTLYLHTTDIAFDKELVDKRAKLYSYKEDDLQLIFFTFMHVRDFVVKRCKHLLPKHPITDEPTKATPSGAMWHEIKHAASRTLVFGTFETLGKANMYDVLDHLELLAKQKVHAPA